MAQHNIQLIKLAFISQEKIYMSPLAKRLIYTLIEQSGIYSNRAVMHTLIEHACKYPYVKELH